jgi:hypothetical protein
VVLETPCLEPPVGNKCNCHEWEELAPEFIADFERVHELDGGRMELAREATAVRASGEVNAIHALTTSHHKIGKTLSELQLFLMSQNREASKRVSGGGKTAKGEAAACLLLLNYCNLLVRGAHASQRDEFAKEAAEMLPTARSLAGAAEAERPKVVKKARESAGAEAERKAADRQKKKGKAKKYYAAAVGRSHGVFTDWDEVESYVSGGFSGSAHRSFKSRHEAKIWYTKKRRIHRRRRQRRGSPDATSSRSDDSRGSRGRDSRRRHKRSSSRGSSSSSGSSGSDRRAASSAKSLTRAALPAPGLRAAPTGALRGAPRVLRRRAAAARTVARAAPQPPKKSPKKR